MAVQALRQEESRAKLSPFTLFALEHAGASNLAFKIIDREQLSEEDLTQLFTFSLPILGKLLELKGSPSRILAQGIFAKHEDKELLEEALKKLSHPLLELLPSVSTETLSCPRFHYADIENIAADSLRSLLIPLQKTPSPLSLHFGAPSQSSSYGSGSLGVSIIKHIAISSLFLPLGSRISASFSYLGIQLTQTALLFGLNDLGFISEDKNLQATFDAITVATAQEILEFNERTPA